MIGSFVRRLRQQFRPAKRVGLYFLAPGVNWVLDWDGGYITREVQKQFGLSAQVVNRASDLTGQIVHYASLWEMAGYVGTKLNKKNKIVGTIFHGQKDSPQFREAFEKVLANKREFARIHTASLIMEERLLAWGIPHNQLVRIPIGVDLGRFRPVGAGQKVLKRRQLGIPEDAICIGSFHKDGVGTGEGNEPKYIKGPDVLLKVIEAVNKAHPVFVLLSAPARGYVKSGLEELGVPYKHIVLSDFLQIPDLYHALDIYLTAAREEGGPKGPLEAMATGIPVVATRVGLVPDLVTSAENGLLAESEDVNTLAEHVTQLIEHPDLGKQLAERGLKTIEAYDWPGIAARYFHEIYAPLLEEELD